MRKQLLLLAAVLVLAGCATTGGPNQDAGMVIGGVLGGLLGAQVDGDRDLRNVAIIAGTLAGSAIGGSIGRSMDATDRVRAGQTLETVRSGVSSSWRNPDTGVEYRFTPRRTVERREGPCREYRIDARIDGMTQEVTGTACRQADGAWHVDG